tara:strand:- start:3697 stop:4794 length:1098 start_codon:yes stop_codon:yes gene_type:complete
MNNSFVIFAGGTGGHVLPAVAFGNYLLKLNKKCTIITDHRGKKFIKDYNGSIKIINASHLSGSFFFKILGLLKLFIGFIQALFFLIKHKPKVAISFGSYAAIPPSLVIILFKIFYKNYFYIHEQNSILGRSNKFFIKHVNKVFLNFDIGCDFNIMYNSKLIKVGLPTNELNSKKIYDKLFLKINKKFVIFVYGGSQGSLAILKCFDKLLSKFSNKDLNSIFFIIQCPKNYSGEFSKKISKYTNSFDISDFFYNLPEILEKTDLIISRCGAGTINDIINYKIPSILIPFPFSKDNHQNENAKILETKECGIILNQNNFDLFKAYNFTYKVFKDEKFKKYISNCFKQHKEINANKLMYESIKNEISK